MAKKNTQKPSRKATDKTTPKGRAKKAEASEAKAKKAETPAVKEALGALLAAQATGTPARESGEREAEPQKEAPKRMKDERLPAPGTRLQKRDRHGALRCEATVEEAGIRYAGQLYRSLSAAASAAASDLGIKGAQNGFIFWGLEKPRRPIGDLVERAEKAWQRYRPLLEALQDSSIPDDQRSRLRGAVRRHQSALEHALQ